jgi:hypothetical protein
MRSRNRLRRSFRSSSVDGRSGGGTCGASDGGAAGSARCGVASGAIRVNPAAQRNKSVSVYGRDSTCVTRRLSASFAGPNSRRPSLRRRRPGGRRRGHETRCGDRRRGRERPAGQPLFPLSPRARATGRQYIPAWTLPRAPFVSGICEMSASVVSRRDDTDAAFCSALRTTLAGSITPAATRSS